MAAFTKLEVKLISHTTKLQVHAKLSNEIPNKQKKAKQSKAKQESAKSTVPVNKTVKQRQK